MKKSTTLFLVLLISITAVIAISMNNSSEYDSDLLSLSTMPTDSESVLQDSSAYEVFPNPVVNTMTIQYDHEDEYFVQITDAQGVVRMTFTGLTGEQTIDVSQLAAAMYTVTLSSPTESRALQVLVKD